MQANEQGSYTCADCSIDARGAIGTQVPYGAQVSDRRGEESNIAESVAAWGRSMQGAKVACSTCCSGSNAVRVGNG